MQLKHSYFIFTIFSLPQTVWLFLFGDHFFVNQNFHMKLINYNSSRQEHHAELFSMVVYNAPHNSLYSNSSRIMKRQTIEPIFKGKPKTREEMWHRSFQIDELEFDQNESLIVLLVKIFKKYLMECTPVILYDVFVERAEGALLQRLMTQLPISYLHGKISANYTLLNRKVNFVWFQLKF